MTAANGARGVLPSSLAYFDITRTLGAGRYAVVLDGVRVPYPIRAKSGPKGWVDYVDRDPTTNTLFCGGGLNKQRRRGHILIVTHAIAESMTHRNGHSDGNGNGTGHHNGSGHCNGNGHHNGGAESADYKPLSHAQLAVLRA